MVDALATFEPKIAERMASGSVLLSNRLVTFEVQSHGYRFGK